MNSSFLEEPTAVVGGGGNRNRRGQNHHQQQVPAEKKQQTQQAQKTQQAQQSLPPSQQPNGKPPKVPTTPTPTAPTSITTCAVPNPSNITNDEESKLDSSTAALAEGSILPTSTTTTTTIHIELPQDVDPLLQQQQKFQAPRSSSGSVGGNSSSIGGCNNSSSATNLRKLSDAEWEVLSDRAASSTTTTTNISIVVSAQTTASTSSARAAAASSSPSIGGLSSTAAVSFTPNSLERLRQQHGIDIINNNSHGHTNSSKNHNDGKCGIQRVPSSSTIDSHENETSDSFVLGPSGKGILGVDYVEHVILPTDTLQGICIAYKVSPYNLKRANHFTGNTLECAPRRKLVIPLSKEAKSAGFIRNVNTDTKEYKLNYLLSQYPDYLLSDNEAKT